VTEVLYRKGIGDKENLRMIWTCVGERFLSSELAGKWHHFGKRKIVLEGRGGKIIRKKD